MVKKLSPADETPIKNAMNAAEKRTAAKIGVVILPSSDRYQDFVLLYGFLFGIGASVALWICGIRFFPWLLAVQLAVVLLMDLTPWLRCLCIGMVPKRIRRHRALEGAHRHYLALHADMPRDNPFVLLFVSVAERYVHVFTNPVVHQKIPDDWSAVTDTFIEKIRKEGTRNACVHVIEHIVKILEPVFPTHNG